MHLRADGNWESMKYILFKIHIVSHHSSAENPSNGFYLTLELALTGLQSPTSDLPHSSSHSLFSIYMSFTLPLKQINLTAASGPVHLLFQFFKWLTLFHHPGLNPNVTSWEIPSTQPPSLYSILVLSFYWNITNWNCHLFAYHLSSTPILLEFKFHEIEDLV